MLCYRKLCSVIKYQTLHMNKLKVKHNLFDTLSNLDIIQAVYIFKHFIFKT